MPYLQAIIRTKDKDRVLDVIAIRPLTSNPLDDHLFIVLYKWRPDEYVTHLYNAHDDGYSCGHYFEKLSDAMEDFRQRSF